MMIKIDDSNPVEIHVQIDDRNIVLPVVTKNYMTVVGKQVIMLRANGQESYNGFYILEASDLTTEDFARIKGELLKLEVHVRINVTDAFLGVVADRAEYITDVEGVRHEVIPRNRAQLWTDESELGITAVNVLPPDTDEVVVFKAIELTQMHQHKALAIIYLDGREGARELVYAFEMHDVVPAEDYGLYARGFDSLASMLTNVTDGAIYGVDFQQIVSYTEDGMRIVTMEEMFPYPGTDARKSTIEMPLHNVN